jgi:S1-C subfamily serine protease
MNFHPTRRLPDKLRRNSKKIAVGMAAIIALVVCNALFNTAVSWLVGIHLGFNAFDHSLVDTRRAQLLIVTLIIDGFVLLWVRNRWISKWRGLFWRCIKVGSLLLACLSLVGGIAIPSFLFIRGQHGGDYGCGQEIGLEQAVNATYPINTDTGGGTAFAIDGHGTLVTAYHVIDGAKTISLGLAGSNPPLKVIRVNKQYDVALLKYDRPTPDYLPLTDTYDITDQVYEIGWPENVDGSGEATITSGIISRDISSQDANDSGDKVPTHMSYIQTDASTNPGNSGGPLLDTCGVVGVMNSSAYSGDPANSAQLEGINYATSSDAVRYALHLN